MIRCAGIREGTRPGHAPLAVVALLCLLGALAAAAPAHAVTVTLQPSSADARIDQAAPTTNYGTATTMQVRSQNGGSGRNARSQVQFDVTSVPPNAVITSASLRLYMVTAPSASRTYEAHRITGTWSESTVAWQGSPTYSNTVTDQAPTGTTGGVWVSFDITTDVQAWVNGTANYGTLIRDSNESANSGGIRADFATREYADATQAPQLVVTYQPSYTITLPAGSAVVMAEPTLLSFTIANADDVSATEAISRVQLTLPYAVADAVPPAGWKVTDITGNQVLFDTDAPTNPGCTTAALASGQSAVFGVYVTATAAGAEVTTDTVSSATVGNDCLVPGAMSYTFGRSGAFPTWTRRGLGATLIATPSALGVNGTVTLTMTVTNRTTGVQNAIVPATPTVAGGSATLLSGPTPASANLAAGASTSFVWTYRPTTIGSFTFSTTATNGTVQTLNPEVSNVVQVGPLTASLAVTPIQPTNGSQVTVTMTITNTGAGALPNVTPSALTTSGTATIALVSGPTPASTASLAGGASTSFMWTYTISGATGDTFAFSGSAAASDGTVSSTVTSATGNIASVGVAVTPASIPVTVAATLAYAVTNQTGDTIRSVVITAPSTAFVYGSATPPSGWQVSAGGTPTSVTFTSQTSGSDIADGGTTSFSITWNAVPAATGTYDFGVDVTTRTNGLGYNRAGSVNVTQYTLAVAAAPSAIPGDGDSATTITATLRNAGTPVNGATVSFSTTLGTLSSTTAVTNASGQAVVTLTAIATASDLASTVTAAYGALTSGQSTVTFLGLTLSLTPATATVPADGQSTAALTLAFRYTASGAAISGATATVALSGSGSVSPTSAASSAGGIAITYTAPASSTDGTATVTVTYRGLTATASTISYEGITVALSPATATVDADGQSTVALSLTFRYTTSGAVISAASATLAASGGGSVSPASAASSASTIAVTYTAPASGSDGTATVSATYRGLSASTSITLSGITVSLAPATATVDADGQSTAGLTLTFRYASGAAITGASATVSLTGAGSVTPASPGSSASGIAVTYTAPASSADGSATVTATYRGLTASSAITYRGITFTLAPGTATVDADGQSTAALTLTFQYTTGGGAIGGAAATITVSAGPGAVSPAAPSSAGGGIAITYTAGTSTTDTTATVRAAYKGLTAVTSTVTLTGITLTLTPASTTVDADGQSTAALTLTARYTTAGTALPAPTTLEASPVGIGGVAPASTSAVTTAVTFTAAAQSTTTSGSVTATYKGLTASTSLTLRTVTLGVAASPATIPADGASTSTLTASLTIGGAAASGVSLAFATSAGALAPTPVATNGSGQATSTLTSSVSGTDVIANVTVTYRGVTTTTSVTFSAASLSLTVSPASIAADGTTTTSVRATLTSGGTPVSGRTVSFATAGATLSGASAATDASGVASVTLRATTASKSTTTPNVTATYGSLTAVQSVTLVGITIGEPVALNVLANLGTNTVSWTWPASGSYTGVLVVRRSGGTPQIPADGVALAVGDTLADGSVVVAKVASPGSASAGDPGLTAATTYYYRAFGYFTSGALYSTAGVSLDAPGTGTGAGQPRWVYNSSTAGTVLPIADGAGNIYWNATDGGILGVSATTGAALWSRALAGESIDSWMIMQDIEGIGGSPVLVTTRSGKVAVVDLATGATVWTSAALGDAIGTSAATQTRAGSDASYQALYTGDLVIVGTKNASPTNNKVYGLDAGTGAVRWTFNATGALAVDQVTSSPFVDEARNLVLIATKSNGGTQPSLWVLSTLDGSVVRTWSLDDVSGQLTYGMDQVVYVPTASGKLYAYDLTTQGLKWTAPYDLGANNGTVDGVWEDWGMPGTLFLSTVDGNVWALVSSRGSAPPSLGWRTAIPGASTPYLEASTGSLWVGGGDGRLHQLQMTTGAPQTQTTLGSGTAAGGMALWDWSSHWLMAPTAAGKVFAIPTPLP